MRLALKEFPKKAVRQSRERLTLVKPDNAYKVAHHPRFWTIPFLIRMLDRIDEVAEASPTEAQQLAEPLPRLAERIPLRPERQFYESPQERLDFCLLAAASLFSAHAASGRLSIADQLAESALKEFGDAGRFARAEALRRLSFIRFQSGDFHRARSMSQEAATLFRLDRQVHGDTVFHLERESLSLLYEAVTVAMVDGPGEATLGFSKALYLASQIRTKRARRVLSAAATNLARDAVLHISNSTEAMSYVRAAKKALGSRRTGVAKLKVHWVEALAGYRLGSTRWAANRLEKTRDRLIELGAFCEAVTCTADLLEMLRDDPVELRAFQKRSLVALKEATSDPNLQEALEIWAQRPADVALLRRVSSRVQPIAKVVP